MRSIGSGRGALALMIQLLLQTNEKGTVVDSLLSLFRNPSSTSQLPWSSTDHGLLQDLECYVTGMLLCKARGWEEQDHSKPRCCEGLSLSSCPGGSPNPSPSLFSETDFVTGWNEILRHLQKSSHADALA